MLNWIRAFFIMLYAHKGQKDKAGKPYFLHPLRVQRKLTDRRAKVVALLHDVVEDSDKYSFDDFYFLDDEQRKALKLLTHEKSVHYFDYIHKIKTDNLATMVKIKDLEDNMNLKRLKEVTEEDEKRYRKYTEARLILMRERV
nr:GTP pyrophosphokinase [Ezakiella coagulans]